MAHTLDWTLSVFQWNKQSESVRLMDLESEKGELMHEEISTTFHAGVHMRGTNNFYLYQNLIVQIRINQIMGDTFYEYHEILFDPKLLNNKLFDEWRIIVLNLWKSPNYNGYITQKGTALKSRLLTEALKLVLGYIREFQHTFPFVIPNETKDLIWKYHAIQAKK